MANADAAPRPAAPRRFAVRAPIWSILFLVLLATALLGLGVYIFSPDWLRTGGDLPVGLRSPLKANYAMDPQQFSLQPVSAQILGEALADRANPQQPQKPSSQLATLMVVLNSPVPSVTPLPGSTSIPAPASSPTARSTATLLINTSTPGAFPTSAASVTAVASATALPSATATWAFPPFLTATQRVITVAPTYPPSPTQGVTQTLALTQPVATQAATRTVEPTSSPSNTPAPSATPTLAPTQVAPTAYPPPPTTPPTAYP